MPKFGTVYFNEDYFGTGRLNQVFRKVSIQHIPISLSVRGTIRKKAGNTSEAVTFRVRRGNGYYGSTAGHRYQDKYKYFAPDPNADNPGPGGKTCFANAVSAWQGLSDAVKKKWNKLGASGYKLPGYNLFISRYMKENYA